MSTSLPQPPLFTRKDVDRVVEALDRIALAVESIARTTDPEFKTREELLPGRTPRV